MAAANPTPEQKLIAEYRASVCDDCSSKSYTPAIDLHFCGECGCPLSKKIMIEPVTTVTGHNLSV